MTAQEAARIAEDFLEDFTLADEYFLKRVGGAKVKRLLYVQYVEPEGSGAHVEFALESDDFDSPEDPEVEALAAKAMDALRRAHPELGALPIRHTFA